MLNLVLGRAGTGKTEYVRNLLCEKAKSGNDKLLLIVPEQFSYSCERAILETLDAKSAQNIEILSFTRLADFVNRKVGGINGAVLDDSAKVILMLHTLNDMKDQLVFYGSQADKTYFANDLNVLFTEFRKECVSADNLEAAASKSQNETLKAKLSDIALILRRYDSILLENGYTDEDLKTTQLIDLLNGNDIFSGYTICIDAFKGFTGQEFEIIKAMESQADSLYISLCIDESLLGKEDDPSMIFGAVKDTVTRLKSICDTTVKVNCTHKRSDKEELRFLEENLFAPNEKVFKEETDTVTLFKADTKYDECNFIAAEIRKLIREEKMRLRDIAVLARNEENYKHDLMAALRRYGVPVYEDTRQPIINQPIITLCKSLLSILMSRELNTKDILTFIKTGFSPLDETEANELENYVFTWNIKGNDWQTDFEGDPQGPVPPEKRKPEALKAVNENREKVIKLLNKFRENVDTTQGKKCKVKPLDISEKLYTFLNSETVKSKFTDYARGLNENGFSDLASEQNLVWEMLMELLNKLAVIHGEYDITLEMYNELFCAACEHATFGTLPHGLDELTIGSADRTRLSNPKVVFACGCIEGQFPQNVTKKGLLTNSDRKTLSNDLDLKISLSNELAACDERFIAYSAVTSSTGKLFVSYHTRSGADEALEPSPLYTEIFERFNKRELDQGSLNAYFYAETPESAFATYASGLHMRSDENIEQYNTIKSALCDRKGYPEKFESLEKVILRSPQKITRENAEMLFRKDMYLSASKVETYYNCPFQYFCRYGLNIRPRKRVELSSQLRGSAIHYVLQRILEDHSKSEFESLEQDIPLQEKLIRGYLADYLEENGVELKNDKKFEYEYNNLISTMTDVFTRMIAEFKVSSFEPIGQEYDIKKEMLCDDGSKMTMNGSIDRVDKYIADDGNEYIRVVDYKTYVKNFRLDYVLAGLNMQMLIYLFTITGKGYMDSATPAGVLYYKTKKASTSFDSRDLTESEKFEKKVTDNRSSGMYLLNDDVQNAMEKDKAELFYPLTDSKGNLIENLVTLEEIGKISKLVDKNLNNMVSNLHNGEIEIKPIYNSTEKLDGCEYCDYANVCGFETVLYEQNKFSKHTKAEVLATLEKDGESDA